MPDDQIAGAQLVTPKLRLRDVDVLVADAVVGGSQETDAFAHDLEHAAAQLHALLLRLGLPDLDDEGLFLEAVEVLDVQILGDRAQSGQRFVFELKYFHVVRCLLGKIGMKPAPGCPGARWHPAGLTWAQFKVKVQGDMAACRDVLNILFPSGEVASDYSTFRCRRKAVPSGSALPFCRAQRRAYRPPAATRLAMRSLLSNGSMVHNENSIKLFHAAAGGA